MSELCLTTHAKKIQMTRLAPMLMMLSSFLFTVPSAISAGIQEGARSEESTAVVHTVVFWFRLGTAETVVETVIEEVKKFESLPMVRAVYVGKALMSDREVEDDSFSVLLTLVFDSEQKLRQYESNAYHQRVSKEIILPHVIRAVIYDHFG